VLASENRHGHLSVPDACDGAKDWRAGEGDPTAWNSVSGLGNEPVFARSESPQKVPSRRGAFGHWEWPELLHFDLEVFVAMKRCCRLGMAMVPGQ